jgi:peptide-methionine (S)-S-oxide reductase
MGSSSSATRNAQVRYLANSSASTWRKLPSTRITYRKLLEFFFQIHDPTTLNRQGNDRGLSYRSAIYYTSADQKRVAEDTIADVDASGLWPGKVTAISVTRSTLRESSRILAADVCDRSAEQSGRAPAA